MNTAKIFFLAFLIFGNVSFGYAQEPNPPTPESKTTPQASPTPSQVPPEINAILEGLMKELRTAQISLTEGQNLMSKSKADSLPAREKLNQALTIFRSVNTKAKDKNLLDKVSQSGETANQSLNYLKTFQYFSKTGESTTLSGIAFTYANLGEWQENVDFSKKAIEIYQEIIADRTFLNIPGLDVKEEILTLRFQEAMSLGGLGGTIESRLGQPEEGIKYLNQSLECLRVLHQETQKPEIKSFEAMTLMRIGLTYGRELQNTKKAIDSLISAIEIFRTFPDRKKEIANQLGLIGDYYSRDFNYEAALKNWKDALKVYQELDDKFGQISILRYIGQMYSRLDDKAKIHENANKSLSILQSPDFSDNYRKNYFPVQDKHTIFNELNNTFIEGVKQYYIGLFYELLENYEKAIEFYEKSLALSRIRQESHDIRSDLAAIGYVYTKLEKWDKAFEYYKQALEISRKENVKDEIAIDLADVGWVLMEAGKPQEALKYQNEGLIYYQSIGTNSKGLFIPRYDSLFGEIARTQNMLGNRRLAIFYGKQAVNNIQNERQRLTNFDAEQQKGFLRKKEKHYRRLADWLIEAGRLVEAERVLAMLKEEEVSDYLRGNPAAAEKLSLRLEYTAEEQKALTEYDKNTATIAAVGAEFGKLEDLKRGGVKLTDEQEKRFGELNEKLRIANQEFQNFLNEFGKEFTNNKNPENDLRENFNLKSDLKSFGEGVVFVYTLVGEEKFSSILVTPKTQFSNQEPMKAAELNKKIFAFREVVKNPNLDPRPLGKELYDVLIKPIEKDLDAAQAKTILWHLDGNLRLLPMAALWDGKQYFGQKYQNVVITGKSLTRIGRVDSGIPNILGLGVSDAKTIPETSIERKFTFNALPSVPFELGSIVKTQKSPKGVLTGESLLNAEFNRKSFAEQLLKGYKIIHIASHFSINAGDASRSFLLLGDGTTLTVSELNTDPSFESKFSDVELLTLSACDTAVGETDSNGKEVEGFAYVAQQNGAKAILATLWSVADESTAFFMSEFYRIKKANPQLSKSEAIQMAQKEMIEGKLQSSTGKENHRAEIVGATENKSNAPRFQTDKSKPFAHPYYWSPFVLIGNWK